MALHLLPRAASLNRQVEAKESRVFSNSQVVLSGLDCAAALVRPDPRIPVKHGLEDGGRNHRLRVGPGRALCSDRNRRRSHCGRPGVGPQGNPVTYAEPRRSCACQPKPDAFIDAKPVSDAGLNAVAKPGSPIAVALAEACATSIATGHANRRARTAPAAPTSASPASASAATTAPEHVRSAFESVGLQLLRREPHLQPSLELLQLLQLHPKFLEEHQRLRGRVCGRRIQPLRRPLWCVLLPRRGDETVVRVMIHAMSSGQ